MGWLFGRSKGRHALGAAVRGIPAGPVVASWASPPVAPTPAAPEPPAAVVDLPRSPAALPVADLLTGLSSYEPVVPAHGPRGEMTFRDGTTAELDPEQARALDEIAQLLTSRPGAKR